jgi:hypothetical protein
MRFLLLLLVPFTAVAQDLPPNAPNCSLASPPEAAAKGVRPPHRQPMRLYPVNPGVQYTGCQWIWIGMARPDVWDYHSVTYYENGSPRLNRITFPPLPVQRTIQTCVFDAAGEARKSSVEGNDWQIGCPVARRLQDFLTVNPPEGGAWDFY